MLCGFVHGFMNSGKIAAVLNCRSMTSASRALPMFALLRRRSNNAQTGADKLSSTPKRAKIVRSTNTISSTQFRNHSTESHAEPRLTLNLKHYPDIFLGETYYKRAYKQANTVKFDHTMTNQRDAARKYYAQQLDTFMQSLTKPITSLIDIYKLNFRHLHPYEATVGILTLKAREKAGNPSLDNIIDRLKALRKLTSSTVKEYAGLCKYAKSKNEAKELASDCFEKVRGIYNSTEASVFEDLMKINRDFRRIPTIELTSPTIVLVGAPNVGKSSLVRKVSSGTPEVSDYPFTTKGVTIGHIIDPDNLMIRYQVMDTPGLLDRPETERNEIEELTYASLAHLPTAVVFVIDPTGLAGKQSTLQAQLNVRTYLKSRFPKRPWIDVVSKGDIEISDEITQQLPPNYLSVSVKTDQNIDVLKKDLDKMLRRLREILITRSFN